jgi:hypothetical protein
MLLNSVAEMKVHYSALHQNMAFSTISSFIEQAEVKYIVPLIGEDQFDELNSYVNDENFEGETLDVNLDSLLKLVNRALTWYALHDAMPHMLVDISDGGVQEKSNSETTQARQWAVNQKQVSLGRSADAFAEAVLKHLHKNIANYLVYEESEAYIANKSMLVNDSHVFTKKAISIIEGRRFLLALAPNIVYAEDMVRAAIGDELFESLKDFVKNPIDDEALDKLLDKAEYPVVFYALADGLPNLDVELSSGGLRFISSMDGLQKKDVLSPEERGKRAQDFKERGEYHLKKLVDFILKFPDDYPSYPYHVKPEDNPTQIEIFNQNTERKSFML